MTSSNGPDQPLVLHDERLGFTQDSTGDALWQGKYFSGISFEADPDTGAIIAVVGYRFGKLHGAWRSWDSAGRPLEEEHYEGGAPHGPRREWHPNGKLAAFDYDERYINLLRKRWDEDGKLVEEKQLLETEPRWAKLEEERKRGPRPIIDIDLKTLTFVEHPEGWGKSEATLPPPPNPPSLEICRAIEARSLARG